LNDQHDDGTNGMSMPAMATPDVGPMADARQQPMAHDPALHHENERCTKRHKITCTCEDKAAAP